MSTIFTIESFAVISNADISILLLNKIIAVDGYEFIHVSPKQLEEEYYQLFEYPKAQIESIASLEIDGQIISNEFYSCVTSSHLIPDSQLLYNSIVFLKRKNSFQYDLEKGSPFLDNNEGTIFYYYVVGLIQKLRLFKSASLKYTVLFHKFKENNRVMRRRYPPIGVQDFEPRYTITEEEAHIFAEHYKKKFDSNLIKLALINFNLSYHLSNRKVMFINLMVCLESLFNLGKDQISHTISRHLAIILSNSLEEFNSNYKKLKKLYSLRSDLVHGNKDYDPHYEAEELQDYVRKAIIFCAEFEGDKKALFEHLNSKGY